MNKKSIEVKHHSVLSLMSLKELEDLENELWQYRMRVKAVLTFQELVRGENGK